MNEIPASPRASATVILLREAAGEIQVLMIRRHANLAFMGGMWVFPGGILSTADHAAAHGLIDASAISCHSLRDMQGAALSLRDCQSLAIAACRETFEETGILLATHVDGRTCSTATLSRLQSQRAIVNQDPAMFLQLLMQEELRLDVGRLLYWAHWITPSSLPRRFDTRFFAIPAPPEQSVSADLTETTESLWMNPGKLIAAAACGEIPMTQPTLYNLEDLQLCIRKHATLTRFFEREASRRVVAILPKIIRENSSTVIVMPWDSSYASASGEGTPRGVDYSNALRHLPSRIVSDRG